MEVVIQGGIHRTIKPTRKDILLIESLNVRRVKKSEAANYQQKIVSKPWGAEYLCGRNKNLEIWELYITPNKATSLHCHPDKDTLNIVLEGAVLLETTKRKEILKAGEFRVLKAGCIHRTTNVNSKLQARILEIESPPNKYNLIRIKDDYGRESVGYVKFRTSQNNRNIRIYRCLSKDSASNKKNLYKFRVFIPKNRLRKSVPIYELDVYSIFLQDSRSELLDYIKQNKIKNLILTNGSLSLYRNGKIVRLLPGHCVFDVSLHECKWSTKSAKLILW